MEASQQNTSCYLQPLGKLWRNHLDFVFTLSSGPSSTQARSFVILRFFMSSVKSFPLWFLGNASLMQHLNLDLVLYQCIWISSRKAPRYKILWFLLSLNWFKLFNFYETSNLFYIYFKLGVFVFVKVPKCTVKLSSIKDERNWKHFKHQNSGCFRYDLISCVVVRFSQQTSSDSFGEAKLNFS